MVGLPYKYGGITLSNSLDESKKRVNIFLLCFKAIWIYDTAGIKIRKKISSSSFIELIDGFW
jgi:hypothetical protein